MHPIERLRYVARADEVRASRLVREAAGALAGFADDPPGLVTACRRLVDRHPSIGPMWWLAARVLCALDPMEEAWRAAEELEDDATPRQLAAVLPEDGAVLAVGWPEHVGAALRRSGHLETFVVDVGAQWTGALDRLAAGGIDVVEVPESGLGPAVAVCGTVLLEASALGPTGFVATAGSRPAAALARTVGAEVIVAAGVGRVLPGRLWDALSGRYEADPEPWLGEDELVPLDLADAVVGPGGRQTPADAVKRADCPIPPELLKGLP